MDLAELAEAAKNCGLISSASPAAQRTENLVPLLGLAARVKELGGKLNEIPTGPRQSLANLLLALGGYATHNAHAKRLGPEALGWEEWGPGIEVDAELKKWAAQLPAGAAVNEGAARALAMYLEARLSKAASDAGVWGADPKAAIFFCANNPDGQRQVGVAVEAVLEAVKSGAIALDINEDQGSENMRSRWKWMMDDVATTLAGAGKLGRDFIEALNAQAIIEINKNAESQAWLSGCESAITLKAPKLLAALLDAAGPLEIEEGKVLWERKKQGWGSNPERKMVSLFEFSVLHESMECAQKLASLGRWGVNIPQAPSGRLPRAVAVLPALRENALGSKDAGERERWRDLLAQAGIGIGKLAIAQGHDQEAAAQWVSERLGAKNNKGAKGASAYEKLAIEYSLRVKAGIGIDEECLEIVPKAKPRAQRL